MQRLIIFIGVMFFLMNGVEKSSEMQKEGGDHLTIAPQDSIPEKFSKGNICWKDSGSSEVSAIFLEEWNSYETVFHNQTYLRGNAWYYGIEDPSALIVSQKIRWSIGNHDSNFPFLTAKGYLISNHSSSGALWSIEIEADEGKIGKNFYQTILYGCCSVSNYNTLFNLLNGKKIVEYTENLLVASIPNTHPALERFIGYKSNNTIAKEDYEKHDSLYLGTIIYASRDSVISKIVLRSKTIEQDSFGFGPSHFEIIPLNKKDKLWNGDELVLWSANDRNDPKLFTNFFVKIKFDMANDSILIPIVDDRISSDNLGAKTFTIKSLK